MASKGDKFLLTSLAVIFVWFSIITVHTFQNISEESSNGPIESIKHRLRSSVHRSRLYASKKLQQQQVYLPQLLLRQRGGGGGGGGDNAAGEEENDTTGLLERIQPEPFPQSIHDKTEVWETIVHPAAQMVPPPPRRPTKTPKSHRKGKMNDSNTIETTRPHIRVPQFWSPKHFHPDVRTFLGEYGERLPTPHEASVIGSHTPTVGGSHLPADIMSPQRYSIQVQPEENEIPQDDQYEYQVYEDVERHFGSKPRENRAMHPHLETIFVAIASYRDYRCPHTVEGIFARSTYPERLRVAIVDQFDLQEDSNCAAPAVPCEQKPEQILCRYRTQIDVFEVDAKLSVGPVFARHIGYRMYRGEYFAMQTDAHMEFVNGWDVELVRQWRSAGNEMAVMTTYVSNVEEHYDTETGESYSEARPLMCDSHFSADYYEENLEVMLHGQEPEYKPEDLQHPTLEPFWAAGFSFARGHFVVQVPYDQYLPMIFQGEEISIGVRAWTYGYDFYAPQKSVIFHYYNSVERKGKKKKVASFWENSDMYNGVEAESKARLAGIIQMLTNYDKSWNAIDAKKYGIGEVRSTQKFYDTFGIHIDTKTEEGHLCKFVGPQMQKEFVPHLRPNGMGIDYDMITYQFKDPGPEEEEEEEEEEEDEEEEEEEEEEENVEEEENEENVEEEEEEETSEEEED